MRRVSDAAILLDIDELEIASLPLTLRSGFQLTTMTFWILCKGFVNIINNISIFSYILLALPASALP